VRFLRNVRDTVSNPRNTQHNVGVTEADAFDPVKKQLVVDTDFKNRTMYAAATSKNAALCRFINTPLMEIKRPARKQAGGDQLRR